LAVSSAGASIFFTELVGTSPESAAKAIENAIFGDWGSRRKTLHRQLHTKSEVEARMSKVPEQGCHTGMDGEVVVGGEGYV
jgi:hypothetical protein